MTLKRVLSIQSHVVSGYVGNKSATFPLQVSKLLHMSELHALLKYLIKKVILGPSSAFLPLPTDFQGCY